MIGVFGNSAIAPPPHTLPVLVLILPQPLENSRGVLQNLGDDDAAFLGVGHAPSGDGLHAVERYLNGPHLATDRIAGFNRQVVAAGSFRGGHGAFRLRHALPASKATGCLRKVQR